MTSVPPPLRVLTVTNTWPTPGRPRTTVFIKRQVEFLRAAGVLVDVFYFDGERRPLRYARAWVRLHALLTRRRYDLIHAQFGQNGLIALPRRVPLVVTFRGSDLLGIIGRDGRNTLAGRVLQAVSRFVARRADAVVVVAEAMKRALPPGVDATVIPSGLDLDLLKPHPRDEARRRLGLPPAGRLVLFAANPDLPRKRHGLARRAVALLEPTLPAELVVAWGVPHADIPYYMSACDALILTSVHEGSPNVVKEALACNLPVVAMPVGDVPERLRGIEGCEVCADDRPETVAAALDRVLRRGGRIDGRSAVRSLDEKLLAQQMIQVYRHALERRPDTVPALELGQS
jgi:glycosyltransferase involved in cell wall biosynthesis